MTPDLALENAYGVTYMIPGHAATQASGPQEMYSYQMYHGSHQVQIAQGDCAFYLQGDQAVLARGPDLITSERFAVVVRGYAPQARTASIAGPMVLPYINGCSIRQVFPPERPGDPTVQLLTMPPHSSEQEHHIHSTVRVVHVLSGSGTCVVGIGGRTSLRQLTPGMSLVLNSMCPHHFETHDEPLVVMPVHVWSSLPAGLESNHPMFNGTHRIHHA
jgi:mannose-6-phosphate isomerase-like protein (cupin superfamily)